MNANSARIARILNDEEKSADTSLRAKAMQRAASGAVPKTLTPYEWEQWYAEHGVPDSHLNTAPKKVLPWWRKWWG